MRRWVKMMTLMIQLFYESERYMFMDEGALSPEVWFQIKYCAYTILKDGNALSNCM
jgi:hypothetical protein